MAMVNTRILVTEDSSKTEQSMRSVRGGCSILSRLGIGSERRFKETFHHPYYFQSWRVTVPKTLGRTLRARLFTGVNAVTLSVGPATEFPRYAESEVAVETVLGPRAAADESARLGLEYMKTLIGRRYRPIRPPTIEQEVCKLLYVPYYAYAGEGTPPGKVVLIEGLTGSRGRVEDVPAIYETFRASKVPVGIGEGG